eukprot:2624750-Rhodomonas_salina.2
MQGNLNTFLKYKQHIAISGMTGFTNQTHPTKTLPHVRRLVTGTSTSWTLDWFYSLRLKVLVLEGAENIPTMGTQLIAFKLIQTACLDGSYGWSWCGCAGGRPSLARYVVESVCCFCSRQDMTCCSRRKKAFVQNFYGKN